MIFVYLYKSINKLMSFPSAYLSKFRCKRILEGNNVRYKKISTTGCPYIMVALGGKFTIGSNFSMNNIISSNPIGCYDRCTFFVDKGALLTIGNNVGISQAAIICHHSITIGDDVKIGGGAKIYDTDFHSLDPKIRNSKDDLKEKKKAPVVIKNNAFIGAFSIILKGVTIGENSIVGAGSVVTKSIPDNQIWAGNPAKFIRNL